MIRSRYLQAWCARLAMLAMLLMLCAPLISRGLPAAGPAYAELCTAAGLQRVALAALSSPPASASPHPGFALPSAGVPSPDADAHAGHADAACDYCLLAARLLPVLLCLLALLPGLRALAPAATRIVFARPSFRWPAHAARGPPSLYA